MDSTMLLYIGDTKGDIYRSNFIFFFSLSLFFFDVSPRRERKKNLYFNANEYFFFFFFEQKRNVFFSLAYFLKYIRNILDILDAMLNYLSARNSLSGRDTKRSCSGPKALSG